MLNRTNHNPSRQGFTLLETILAVSLLVMLASVTMVTVSSLNMGRELDEGAMNFEALLRTMRVEAADRARVLRLDIDADGSVSAWWEPDPLEQPGEFSLFTAGPVGRIVTELRVRVSSCLASEPGITPDPDAAMNIDDSGITMLYFQPDGSCMDAVFELASHDENDERIGVIEMDGLFGQIKTEVSIPEME